MTFGATVAIPQPAVVVDGKGRGIDTAILVAVVASALLIIAALRYGRRRRRPVPPQAVSTRTRLMLPPADDDTTDERPWRTVGTVYTTLIPADSERTIQLSALTTTPRHGR